MRISPRIFGVYIEFLPLGRSGGDFAPQRGAEFIQNGREMKLVSHLYIYFASVSACFVIPVCPTWCLGVVVEEEGEEGEG